MENVKTYRYLGCEVKYDEPTTGETELNLRSDATDCKFYSLARNLMNMKIRLTTRIRILNSLVRSRIVYSCQTWSTTKVQLNRMNALYLTFIRKMVKGGYKRKGDTWSFVFSNEDLIRMAKTTDLSSYIRKQQRNYAGHIIRKENSSIVKRLFFNSNASHKPGRQTTLHSSVIMAEKRTKEEFYMDAINRKF